MSKEKVYPNCAQYADELMKHVLELYDKKYETQVLTTGEGASYERIVQLRTRYKGGASKWSSKLSGLDRAATIKMRVNGPNLATEVGQAEWLDKAAVAGFATFVALGVLLIPVGIGIWRQSSMLKELETEVDRFLAGCASKSAESTVPASCPKCGNKLKDGDKFCGSCGAGLV